MQKVGLIGKGKISDACKETYRLKPDTVALLPSGGRARSSRKRGPAS